MGKCGKCNLQKCRSSCNKGLFKKILKFAFSSVGLTILGPLYIFFGAYLFKSLEEADKLVSMKALNRMDLLLANYRISIAGEIADKLHLCQTRKCPSQVIQFDTFLKAYQHTFSQAVKLTNGRYSGKSQDLSNTGWSYPSALLFALSIVTTIGYGNVYLVTIPGQIAVMFYAVFAIPLITLWLGSIADLVSSGLSFLYYRIFCGFCANRRKSAKTKRLTNTTAFQTDRPDKPSKVKSETTAGYKVLDEELSSDEEHLVEQNNNEFDKEEINVIPIAFVVGVVITFLLLGIVPLHLSIGVVGLDGVTQFGITQCGYLVMITVSTIGFGDFYASPFAAVSIDIYTGMKLAYSTFYVVMGLAMITVLVQSLIERIEAIKAD